MICICYIVVMTMMLFRYLEDHINFMNCVHMHMGHPYNPLHYYKYNVETRKDSIGAYI